MKRLFAALLATLFVITALCVAQSAFLTVSAESTNIALGKKITGADPTSGNQYTDKYTGSLVDGEASIIFDGANAPADWFCYYYNADLPSNAVATDDGALGEFTIDLGAEATVESVRIHMIATDAYGSSGIKVPTAISVQYSTDNSSWSDFGEVTDFSSYEDIDWVVIDGGEIVDAQYVKVAISYPGYSLMLNEVEVIGTGGAETAPSGTPSDNERYETFDLTALDELAPEADENGNQAWYADGIVVAITNDSNADMVAAAGDYAMRYLFILIFDSNGVCVEVGNNLFSADDERANEFPQHDITIPAGGFAVLFYYNANEAPSNQVLYDYYSDLAGGDVYNSTIKAVPGKDYTAEIENKTVTIYFTEPAEADTPSEDTSSEESAEGSSEEPSSEAPAEDSASAETTSSAPTNSGNTSAPSDDGGLSTGAIVGIVVAVVAVVAIAAVVVVVMKKKKS